jgi:tetratricopeptide (TPR) repeat protein
VTEQEDKATRRERRRDQKKSASEGAEGTREPESAAVDPKARDAGGDEEKGTSSDPTPAARLDQIKDRNARLRAQAAEERRAKRDREKVAVAAVPIGLDAGERMDDIFVRTTHAAAGWLKQNFRWLQWVVIGGVLVGLGSQTYRYVSKSRAAKSADALAIGLMAEGGSIRPASSTEPGGPNPEFEQLDSRPVFDSEASRLAEAEQGYRKAIASYGQSGAGWLARLGLAGVLFDEQKWDEAVSLYRTVRTSELAKKDPDMLGRSLEGIGLSLEGKGDIEGALQAFRELTNQEGSASLATLGLYHQARLLLAQGNKDKAKELANKAKERLDKDAKEKDGDKGENAPPSRRSFLSESVKMLLARIDPAAAPGSGSRNLADALREDPNKLQRMLEGLKQRQPAPSAPGGEQ